MKRENNRLQRETSYIPILNSEKKETALDKLVTSYEKSKLENNKPNSKAKTLEEILKSNPNNSEEATKDLKEFLKENSKSKHRGLDIR